MEPIREQAHSPTPTPRPPSAPQAPAATKAKADLGKRFVAVLLDGLIAGIGAAVFMVGGFRLYGIGLLLGAAYILVRDGLDLDFMDNRSIGKKIMKLRPQRLDGQPMDIETSVRRNWTLALGTAISGLSYLIGGLGGFFVLSALAGLAGLLGLAEAILVLTDNEGRRIGDKMAETKVVEVVN